MNDQQRALFEDVVELGSFSKAAQRRYVTTQTVSQQIRRLEDELGFDLLERTSRGVVPTEVGLAFYEGCRRIDQEIDELSAYCADLALASKRTIVLGSLGTASLSIVSQFLPRFLKEHPDVHVKYVKASVDSIDDLVQGRFDLAESARPGAAIMHDRDELAFLPLVTSQRRCLVSPGSPLARLDSIRPEDLSGKRVYVYDLNWASDLGDLLHGLGSDVELRAVPERNHQAIVRICRSEEAVFLMPERIVSRLEELVAVPLALNLETAYGLLYLERDEPRLRDFLNCARMAFAE